MKKPQDSVQTSAQLEELATLPATDTVETPPVDPAVQEAQKQKLIVSGIDDPSHLEIITDKYAGQGGSYVVDPETGIRTKID